MTTGPARKKDLSGDAPTPIRAPKMHIRDSPTPIRAPKMHVRDSPTPIRAPKMHVFDASTHIFAAPIPIQTATAGARKGARAHIHLIVIGMVVAFAIPRVCR
ncbi:MAG TPA: hypothetical protein VK660_09530 [Xanthomonadaceae bacterium]|nr:hypothetical protein [Xanthomonadaceae bacterium]